MARKNSTANPTDRIAHAHHTARHPGKFARFAYEVAHLAGRPGTFLAALIIVIAWAATGPLFSYSDTWQLVINTSTTIITFLMVFLIQNTQNRDAMAVQAKLAELIIVVRGAKNEIATAEDLSDEELEQLHHDYQQRAAHALSSLERRRSRKDTASMA